VLQLSALPGPRFSVGITGTAFALAAVLLTLVALGAAFPRDGLPSWIRCGRCATS